MIHLLGKRLLVDDKALFFGAATSDRVDFGSPAALDNLLTLTYLVWCYPTTLNASRRFINKGIGTRTQSSFHLIDTSGNIQYLRGYSGTPGAFTGTSSDTPLALNTWCFVGCVFNSGVSPQGKLYRGKLNAAAVECAYSAQTDGVGTPFDDSANSLFVGNAVTSSITAFQGRIAWAAIWNRVLTLTEIQEQQFRPNISSGCVLFTRLGRSTGTQVDESASALSGTVTGATAIAGLPRAALRAG